MVHQLTADPVRLTAKPEPTQIALIKKRMQRATVQTVRDFIENIGVRISWSGGIFKNDHLKNKNFIQASIVALDFDGEGALTPQQAIDRIQKYQITPSCWYPSFSDDPQGTRKFRLVFFLDRPIKDQNAYSTLMTLFFESYPEVDRLKDAARFCYGTNSEGVVLNPDEIPLDDLVTVLRTHAISKAPLHKNRHKTKGGKALQASFADCVYNNSINSKHSERKVMKQRYGRLKKNMKKNVDWDKLASRVKVFDQFLNGDERLRYSQLEGIATNLAWMKSGSRVYKDTLEKFNKNHEGNDPYQRDGRFELLRDFRQRNQSMETAMFPMNLDNPKFMAPKEDHQYKNLIEAERDQVKGVKIKEPIERMTLPKAENLFSYRFNQVMDSWDTDIHIFKVHTALGKTRAIKDAGSNTLLCFPTHDLKDDVAGRRADKHTFIITPRLPRFESMRLNNRLTKL